MQRRPKQNLVTKSLNTNVSAVKNEEHNKLIFNLRRFVRNQRKSRNVISKNKKIQKEEKNFTSQGRRKYKQSQNIIFGTSIKRDTFQENQIKIKYI